MNRRGFLAALGVTAAGAATGLAVPELWTPKRTFFLPPRGGWQKHFADPYAYQWQWVAGGSGLTITDPLSRKTAFVATKRDGCSGSAQCTVTDSNGRQQSTVFYVNLSLDRDSIIVRA